VTFYAEMAETAQALMAEFGQVVTLTESTPGAYDTALSKPAAPDVTTQTAVGVVREYSSHSIDGTLIQAGDLLLITGPKTTAGAALAEPTVESGVTFADETVWTVKRVETVKPAGVVLAYRLQLRQ
jgi:hypothetical protein